MSMIFSFKIEENGFDLSRLVRTRQEKGDRP